MPALGERQLLLEGAVEGDSGAYGGVLDDLENLVMVVAYSE